MPTPQAATPKVLSVPFRVSGDGSIAFVTSPSAAAAEEVRTIVQTTVNERVMRPEFGSPVGFHLFDPITNTDNELVSGTILTALEQWATLSSQFVVTVDANGPNPGNVSIAVTFTVLQLGIVLQSTITVGA